MDEIKVWTVDGAEATPVQKADAMSSELLLERTLVAHPELLMPNLKLVGRQTPTEGGPLDLLGVDEDGRLVVFELKRGTLSRDAVAQVIDYASYLDSLGDDVLTKFISRNSGKHGVQQIDDFENWYRENTDADGLESLRPIRMVLVGLGVDDRTERMVRFLAKNSRIDISLLTFHGFAYEGKTLLARQVRIESVAGVGDGGAPDRKQTREETWNRLIQQAKTSGTWDLFEDANQIFRMVWSGARERANKSGLRFRLRGPRGLRSYARVDPEEAGIRVVFFDRAVALCPEEFQEAVGKVPYDTRPSKNKPLEPGTQIQFKFPADNWKEHRDTLDRLVHAVHGAWQQRNERGLLPEADANDDLDEEDYD